MKTPLLKKPFTYTPIVIALLFFSTLNAQIVYTDVVPDSTINSPGISYHLDLNSDGTNDFDIKYENHMDTLCGYAVVYSHIKIFPKNNNEVLDSSLYPNDPKKLGLNTPISIFSSIWSNTSGQPLAEVDWQCPVYSEFPYPFFDGVWTYPTDGCLGLKIYVNSNVYFGWARIVTDSLANYFTIKDYAYNSISNSSILAGDSGLTLETHSIEPGNQLRVFPNPVSDKITLLFPFSAEKEIQITNTLGQIVFSEKINSMKKELDVRDFPVGMFVLSAQTSTQVVKKKFLKQ